LRWTPAVCYSSRPASAARGKAERNQVVELGVLITLPVLQKNDGVDELSETLHNLSSLLLTNTTIRRTQQGNTEHGSLTINSR
jgi:hypothetical protein